MTSKPHEMTVPISNLPNETAAIKLAKEAAIDFFGGERADEFRYQCKIRRDLPTRPVYTGVVVVTFDEYGNKEETE